MGSYNQNWVIMNRVIKRLQCIFILDKEPLVTEHLEIKNMLCNDKSYDTAIYSEQL